MSKPKNAGSVATVTVEPDPASNPDPITGAPRSHPVGTAIGSASGTMVGAAGGHAVGEAVDPSIERDYWHVNYMTRPYYKEGRSFGDYEAAYRYGWENAEMPGDLTFEEAEKAHLSGGWTAARGESPHAWADVREATRDAWTRARRNRTL